MTTIQSPDGRSDFYVVGDNGEPCGHKHATFDEANACAGLPPAVNVTGQSLLDEDAPSVYDRPFPYPEDDQDA